APARLRVPHPHRQRALRPPHQPHPRHLPPKVCKSLSVPLVYR
ncbi:hypothetical protein CFC21_049688, partial [Triticum aestivum]